MTNDLILDVQYLVLVAILVLFCSDEIIIIIFKKNHNQFYFCFGKATKHVQLFQKRTNNKARSTVVAKLSFATHFIKGTKIRPTIVLNDPTNNIKPGSEAI